MLRLFKKEVAPVVVSNINSVVREGNNYFSDELICLNEALEGNFYCDERVLIAAQAVFTGNITAKTCTVSGKVNGSIATTEMLEIAATAVIDGDIKSAVVNIEPGAIINGRIAVAEDKSTAEFLSSKTKKYSSDDYLSARLSIELAELNISRTEPESVVLKPIETPIAPKAAPIEEPAKPVAQKPLTAPAAAPISQELPKINKTLSAAQPAWQTPPAEPVKKVLAAAAPQAAQSNHTAEPAKAPAKPLTAPAPKAPESNSENNNRWW